MSANRAELSLALPSGQKLGNGAISVCHGFSLLFELMQHNLKKNILSKPNLLTLDIKRQFNQFNFVMELPENKWQGDICLAKKPLM